MPYPLNDSPYLMAPKVLDARYGPWVSVEQAFEKVPKYVRSPGLTVGVLEDLKVIEYWWEEGIEDDDLKLKNHTQSDWTEENTQSPAFIHNRPTIPNGISGLTPGVIPKAIDDATLGDSILSITDDDRLKIDGLKDKEENISVLLADGDGVVDSFTPKTIPDLNVGDEFGGGYFVMSFISEYPDQIGNGNGMKYALIVAKSNSGIAKWGCKGVAIGGLFQGIGLGKNNTDKILEICAERPIAASMARDLIDGDYNDWQLPSRLDLQEIYHRKGSLGDIPTDISPYYWSSEENSSTYASTFAMDGSFSYAKLKDTEHSVRAVRYHPMFETGCLYFDGARWIIRKDIGIPKPNLEIISHNKTPILPSVQVVDKIRMWWEQWDKAFTEYQPEIWLFRDRNYQRRKKESDATLDLEVGTVFGGGYFVQAFTGVDNKKYGLIVAKTDSGEAEFGCHTINITGTSDDMGTGKQNTLNILDQCAILGIAARIVDDETQGDKTDWHLPSKDELAAIYANKSKLGVFSNDYYWSSSETEEESDAMAMSFTSGYQGELHKSYEAFVRAVRYELMEGVEFIQRVRKKKWAHEPHLNGIKFLGSKFYSGVAANRNTEWELTAKEREKQDIPFDLFSYFKGVLGGDTDYSVEDIQYVTAVNKRKRQSRTSNILFRVAIVIDNPDKNADNPKLIGPLSDVFSVNPVIKYEDDKIAEVKWVISFHKRQKI
jgi:hypothetical protein